MKTQVFKSIVFVFVVHLLAVCTMFFEDDGLWFVLHLVLCIATIPVYFMVKADPPHRWWYTLTAAAAHVIFTLLVYFSIGKMLSPFLPTDWPAALIHFTELFLSAAFCITFVIDSIVNAKR